MKGVHRFYQFQVVSDDDNVRIAPTRPQKRTTQPTPTEQLSCKNRFGFCVFMHKGSSMGSYQGFTTLLSRPRGQKWIQDLFKPSKTLYIPKKSKERKKKKNRQGS